MTDFINKYFPKRQNPPNKPGFVVKHPLHLNEMPENIPEELRDLIANRIKNTQFNRYPDPFGQSLTEQLALWYGCNADQIMVAPGSSAFIRLLLVYFGLNIKGKIVITRPSFSYYEQCCESLHIPFESWDLDQDFNYVSSALDSLPDYSVIFLTTPNNPTGNTLSRTSLQSLLTKHKNCLFVVDEAYAEFVNETMLPLLPKHNNLVLLRTFSKAFCVAGIRCGLLFTNESLVKAFSGLQMPWQLTPFTIEATKEILNYAEKNSWFKDRVKEIVDERDHLFQRCSDLKSKSFKIYPSHANFLLIKNYSSQVHTNLLSACADLGVLVRDLSNEPRLENYVRVTIGKKEENDLFYKAFHKTSGTS